MAIFNFGPWETKGLPVLDAALPADITVAATNSATFKVCIVKDGTPKEYTYQWYEDGKAISGATSDTYVRSTTKSDGGTHLIYCIVTNKAGTVTSRTATLTVDDSAFRAPKFSYNDSYSLTDDSGESIQQGALVGDWMLTLKTSGTLHFSDLGSAAKGIEVFLCGGGGNGGRGHAWSGGGGGGGGYTANKTTNVSVDQNYPITIGGSGGNTTAFSTTAQAGENGADSGTGADAAGTTYPGGSGTGKGGTGGASRINATDGQDGVYAFNGSSGIKYGAGGGGGKGVDDNYPYIGKGGVTGGGSGTDDQNSDKSNGVANTGGGGGGGNPKTKTGGTGGSGVVIIRNKRS